MSSLPLDPAATLAAELARLRQDYLARLPEEMNTLDTLADELLTGHTERATELEQRLHKLAGSGGTFGLGDLGQEARELEILLKKDNAAALPPERLRQGLRRMRQALGRATGTQEPALAPPPRPGMHADVPPLLWLAEDDPLQGRELETVLGQFGYRVRWFARIADLVDALRRLPDAAPTARPQALILDVFFPAEGGTTYAALTRAGIRELPCPTLFITADNAFATRVEAARHGAAAFLLKPFDISRLVDRLEALFEQQRAAPYRVLLLDDDQTLASHFALVLRAAGMEVEVLHQPDALLERVADFRPELILMDLHMPQYSGPELAAVLRQHDEWLGLPIVYLSAETDLDQQIQALDRGADDFLTKPISDPQLIAAVRVRVTRSRQLADLMSKDSLTGLLKHSRIKEEVDLAVARARRSGKPVSVAMVDIDHFKSVNDQYGHPVGDRVIKAVAHLLRQRLRQTDLIGRYGGEEFALALPDCDAATAQRLLDDIRERFARLHFRQGDCSSAEFACTLSAGIVSSADQPALSGAQLLGAADEALYNAKRGGRNQVCIYRP